MKVTDRLKQVVFKHLYKELGNAEIIPYNNSIWFIDRENTYWYFELTKIGKLWWRYDFFTSLFQFFSMNDSQFVPILIEWVEEVLNSKVSTTNATEHCSVSWVEEVLNCKAPTTRSEPTNDARRVEEVLNSKVDTTVSYDYIYINPAEEVLNSKVSTTNGNLRNRCQKVEEVLNHKVLTTESLYTDIHEPVEEVLNQK